jgi:DNA-binding NarL/FixJ family response regulator
MYKMLVADDHAEFCESLAQTLSSHFPSYEVFVAGSVEEVMLHIISNTPNVLFMSIRFSHGTGLELCKYLKSRFPDIDIIVMSSFDSPEYRKAAFNIGAKYFMPKDSLPDEIYSFLSSLS